MREDRRLKQLVRDKHLLVSRLYPQGHPVEWEPSTTCPGLACCAAKAPMCVASAPRTRRPLQLMQASTREEPKGSEETPSVFWDHQVCRTRTPGSDRPAER
ncbi:hypothetical protein NDU88_001709 [Pleurodeles waltl]|uniref:Uncharacterized protein n=1 Tax=Pleurodeles waltl TaxID=8319 RepID=A0AAV7TJ09_PLEWA|nr:hypothetical protein NDU88_001709 [Pleurodeles waltl]